MPIYKYIAIDSKGQKIHGEVEAKDRANIVSFLTKEPVTIVSISEVKGHSVFFAKGETTVQMADLVVFSRQLAVLVKTGVPLVRGLGIIAAQVENKALRNIVNSLQVNIESGRSLSEALGNYPKVFSPIFIHMVKAGEIGGALDAVLERMAEYLEESNKLVRKVKGALTYPAIVISVSILIVSGLFLFVIPTFESMFKMLDIKLPFLTQMLINISNLLKHGIVYIIIAITVVIVFVSSYLRTQSGKLFYDKASLKLPVFGGLILKVIVARFARTLSTLVKSGLSILNALDIVSKTSDNLIVENILIDTKTRVARGEKIGESLKIASAGLFAPMVVDMISVGEETGNISTMMDKIADFYESEVDTAVSTLMSLIEPMVIVFLGVVVGTIAVSLFLPLFEILKKVGAH